MNIPNITSSNPPHPPTSFETIDAILTHHARSLRPGESISIPLYKSANGTITSIDPLQASRASKAAAAIGAKTITKSVKERSSVKFPRVMKFIETVEDPDFGNGKGRGETFRDGRLYVEDIPKAKDDSDDDEDGEGGDGTAPSTKRKRWRRNQPPKQQWVLQPRHEFSHKFQAKQMRSKDPAAAALLEKQLNEKLSNRYHGREEANSSAYVILGAGQVILNQTSNYGPKKSSISNASISVMPMHGYTNFTQPAKFHTLSMQEAEQALNTQSGLSRYMMHGGNISANNSSHISTATGEISFSCEVRLAKESTTMASSKRKSGKYRNKQNIVQLAEELAKTTHFTKRECESILHLYPMQEKCDRSTFRDILHVSFNMTDDILMDRVFRGFDKDNDSSVSCNEWVEGLSVFLRGNMEEKMKYCFDVYDLNNDGYISREEMFHMLKTCLVKIQTEEDPDEGTKDLVEIVLKKLDKDHDGKVSFADFKQSVELEQSLLEVFGQCLPSPETRTAFLEFVREGKTSASSS